MKTKTLIALALLALVLLTLWWIASKQESAAEPILSDYEEVANYESDTVLTDPVTIAAGEAYVTTGDTTLTFAEDAVVNGAIGCRDGSLTLVFSKQLTLNDTIVCEEEDANLTIIAVGGLTMSDSARIVAQGDLQIVDEGAVVRSPAELAALYDEVTRVPESGVFVGPFVDEDEGDAEVNVEGDVELETEASAEDPGSFLARILNVAHAQVDNATTTVNLTGEPIRVSGKIIIKGPVRKGAKRVVVFDFPNTPEVTIQDFELEGPAGRPGDPDSGNCNVSGSDGEDAFRFNAFAPNLIVNNFTLTLGDGGEGGEATTGGGCDDARAKGGKGGKPGNFRMIGSEKFEIKGAFMIHPGNGGGGGGATATGKAGDPGEKGGDATATGGQGADNKKKLTVSGTVAGTSNVEFGDAVGGFGGAAVAEGGKGGDADECGMAGGPGGKATAKSGDGGDAKLSVSGGAGRMEFANDIGGRGGVVEAYGGDGGTGGSCGSDKKGGDGGGGGDASASEGKGGMGKSGRAADGSAIGDDGGDGGNGGDGCTEGIGGAGGSGGIEDGERGEDGENLCVTVTKEEDYISLLPGEIQVIAYRDYYIPIENLSKFTDPNGNECDGEEHWHPGPNGAINLRGMAVPDPDPNNCGFGKTSEVPVIVVDDPNYVDQDEEEEGGGRMIRVDPPTLVIPAQ